MSKREREAERRVMPKLTIRSTKHPARARYWEWHDKPVRKVGTVQGLAKRLRREETGVIQQVADLGQRSDVAVLKLAPSDLVRNRAFAEHQQKLAGAIYRFRKQAAWQQLPKRVVAAIHKTAFIIMAKEGR